MTEAPRDALDAPPAGGVGARSASGGATLQGLSRAPPAPPLARRVAVAAAVAAVAALVAFGPYVRQSIEAGRTAEPRRYLTTIGRLAAAAYARDGRVCPSASVPVPAAFPSRCTGALTGIHTPRPFEWRADEARGAGFACLGFEESAPQYYQYMYTATEDGFVARAASCVPELEAIGPLEIRGHVEGGRLVVGEVVVRRP